MLAPLTFFRITGLQAQTNTGKVLTKCEHRRVDVNYSVPIQRRVHCPLGLPSSSKNSTGDTYTFPCNGLCGYLLLPQ